MQALSGVRVLDLTSEVGAYASKLFSDLGAEVIRIEPLEGSPIRNKEPFYGDTEDGESSFQHWYFNTHKKGVALDLSSEEGWQIIRELAKTVDILIEDFSVGKMKSWGLGYEELSILNPSLVYTSITPFGQYGPYKDYQANDLVGLAMGGLLYLGGEPERSPVRAFGDQGYFAAALFGAVGTMIAFYHAEETGEGQYVDVSMQESIIMALENAVQFYDLQGIIRKRVGGGQIEAAWGQYPCRDGYIYLMIGGFGIRNWDLLVDWLEEEDTEKASELRDTKWREESWRKSQEGKRLFNEIFTTFTLRYNKQELYEEGQRRNLAVCPLNDPADLFENPQLQYRGFFTTIMHEKEGEIVYPGAPYRFSQTPWKLQSQAPRLGQHTVEVLSQIYSPEEVSSLLVKGVVK